VRVRGIIRSFAVDAALIGVVVLGAALLVRNWIAPGSQLLTISHPKLDALEPISRRHILAVRQASERILGMNGASAHQRAGAFAEMGSIYLAYGFYPTASDCFQNAGILEPDEFRWPYLQARTMQNAGKSAEAAAAVARSLKRMDTTVAVNPLARLAALSLLGESAIRLNKPLDARKAFEAALQVNPNAPFALVKLGQLASRSGDSEQAIAHFQRALTLLPNRADVRYLLAAEYQRRGEAAKAALNTPASDANRKDEPLAYADPIYASVMSLNQSSAWQNSLGVQSSRVGRWRVAMAHFKRAVEANPDSPEVRANYGRALLILGDVPEAQTQLEEAFRLDPQSEQIRSNLCSAWAASPNTQGKALADALAWSRLQNHNLMALNNLADVYMRLGRYQDALRVFAESGRLAPAEIWPRLGQARTQGALGRYSDARQTLEEALQIFPSDPDLRLNAARFLVACPDMRVRDQQRGLELSRELVESHYSVVRAETLALALAANGRWDEAMKIQRQAVADCGEDGDPRLRERLRHVLQSIQAHKAWREQWPFREITERVN
jgi:tetratricopeptide (TPR) repeat protein